MQRELKVMVAAGSASYPLDQDDVGVVADGEVRGVPGGLGELAQVRDLTQLQGPEHRESQVQDARGPGRYLRVESSCCR